VKQAFNLVLLYPQLQSALIDVYERAGVSTMNTQWLCMYQLCTICFHHQFTVSVLILSHACRASRVRQRLSLKHISCLQAVCRPETPVSAADCPGRIVNDVAGFVASFGGD
jgi:hypothetical protein